MQKIAFFDFDNTIYDGYTFEDFIEFVSRNVLKTDRFQNQVKNILQTTTDYNDIASGIAEIVGEIIVGWPQKKFEKFAKISCNKKKISGWVKPVTSYLKSMNFKNIVVSASFEEMIADSLEVLEIDKIYCSTFALKDKRFTGKIKLLLNEDKKVEVIKSEISNNQVFSIAFGDSVGDAPMLDSVDKAFLVRSYNEEIEKFAKKKGWFLGNNPDEIIKELQKNI